MIDYIVLFFVANCLLAGSVYAYYLYTGKQPNNKIGFITCFIHFTVFAYISCAFLLLFNGKQEAIKSLSEYNTILKEEFVKEFMK